MNDRIREEVVANNVGGGNVAGLGVGPQGEPGVSKKKKKSPILNFKDYIKRTQVK